MSAQNELSDRSYERQRVGERPLAGARSYGFSLLEVVAAVAIFSLGMLAVLGLFAPVTQSVSASSDAEAAARVADAVRARLQAMPFASVAALLQDAAAVQKNNATPTYNPASGNNPAVIFARLNGELGFYDATANRKNWRDPADKTMADADKFFEIDLIRNAALTPKDDDATGAMLAYTMRVRWPAFVQTSASAAVQNGQNAAGGSVPFDQGKKQVMFFTGAVLR
jgi:prepilin-type N-terminal cleavage/methylation domain-containing protein